MTTAPQSPTPEQPTHQTPTHAAGPAPAVPGVPPPPPPVGWATAPVPPPTVRQPTAQQPTRQPAGQPDPWRPPAVQRDPAPAHHRSRPGWLPVVGVAATTALVASLATVGVTTALGDAAAPTPASVATLEQDASVTVPVAGSSAEDPDWQAVAAAVRASVVAIDVLTQAGSGTGSGVIVDAEGHILTNDHVVGDAVADGLRVTLADGRVHQATIVGLDPTTDLAVIVLDDPPADLVPAALGDSDEVEIGEPVMAVGNPLGLDSTVTTGIVSALDRPVSTSDGRSQVVTNAIQIDAAVNPGNSGGPLFDASGEVIGITSSIASLSQGGGTAGSIGLGFAIPANLADRIGAELIEDGSAEHAFLGVSLSDGTATADGTTRRGAVVEEVGDGSPAAEAQLQVGDVVVAIDGDPVNGAESLTAFVRERTAGAEVSLTVVRDGESLDVVVRLATREEVPEREQERERGGLVDPRDPRG